MRSPIEINAWLATQMVMFGRKKPSLKFHLKAKGQL